jgi:hypothetical protein
MERAHAQIRRLIKDVVSIVVTSFLAGCATPFSNPQLEPDDVPFQGIQDAISNGGEPADVLLVHGMCTHKKEDLQGANAALAKALNMQPQRPEDVTLETVWGDENDAQLFTATLSDGVRSVRTYSLLWSPIATRYKRARLCYDVSEPTASCSKEVLTYAKPRAWINKGAKDVLLDDCLADAVFYSAPDGGKLLRDATLKAIVTALAGGKASAGVESEQVNVAAARTAPFFIITHSLGSKIVADALHQAPRAFDEALTFALGRTYQVFMEANQLPILSLGIGSISKRVDASPVVTDLAMNALIARLIDGRHRNRGPRVLTDEPIVVVAFSDPNDLLSWGLHDSAVQLEGAKTVDVWVSNASSWFGGAENPLAAHVGYAANPAVAKLIACGWKRPSPVPACQAAAR